MTIIVLKNLFTYHCSEKWCHDTQQNDTQHKYLQHNDTQNKELICDTKHSQHK